MKTYFNVEVLGREVSIYGGVDGHYCGTRVVGGWIGDIVELDVPDSVVVSFCQLSTGGLVISFVNCDKLVVEPKTRFHGIRVPFAMYDVVTSVMGVTRVGDNFEKYFETHINIERNGMTFGEFKELVKKIMA